MNEVVKNLWPELEWIADHSLREKTAKTWELALGRSVLKADDLNKIPFTLLCGPDLKISFMEHKRCVVHISKACGEKMNKFFGEDLPVNMDVLISGAILADVGKLIEYELDEDGKSVQGMFLAFDEKLLEATVGRFKEADGVVDIKVWINQGRLSIGDDIMFVLVAGRFRTDVLPVFQELIREIKNNVVNEKEM